MKPREAMFIYAFGLGMVLGAGLSATVTSPYTMPTIVVGVVVTIWGALGLRALPHRHSQEIAAWEP